MIPFSHTVCLLMISWILQAYTVRCMDDQEKWMKTLNEIIQTNVNTRVKLDDLKLLFGEDRTNDYSTENHSVKLKDRCEITTDYQEENTLIEPCIQENHSMHGIEREPDEEMELFIKHLIHSINDPDCVEGELDFRSENFSIERASQIWHKCRLLILRNFYDQQDILNFRMNVTKFVYDLKSGRVNANGKSTYADNFYVYDVDILRWDLLLPSRFFPRELMENPTLLRILEDDRVLGEYLKLLSYGLVLSEPGASEQQWHQDAAFLFGQYDALVEHGIAGLQWPSNQITMMAPLLNITHDHGPTQFCIGSASLNGLLGDVDSLEFWYERALERSPSLMSEMSIEDFSMLLDNDCPARMWRSTELNFGDVALWDFDLMHRAGPNNSTDFRSALYASFARSSQIEDANFYGKIEEQDFAEKSFKRARFGIPNSEAKPLT